MAPTLLTWPPGVTPSRFNLLQRRRFCAGVPRCVHEDMECCCKGAKICGCPNWQGECVTNPLPDLVATYSAPTCNGASAAEELDGLVMDLLWCRCFVEGGVTPCNNCDVATGDRKAWFGEVDPTGQFSCIFGHPCSILECIINPATMTEPWQDYFFIPNFDLSGACTYSPNGSYPTSGSCGDGTNPFVLRYEGVFQLEEVFPSSCGCCTNGTFPIPFDVIITGPPRAAPSFASFSMPERRILPTSGRGTAPTGPQRPRRVSPTGPQRPRRVSPTEAEPAELPPDVENWLQNNGGSNGHEKN